MQKVYVYPLPITIWHRINAVGFAAMILAGSEIRYVGLVDVLPFSTAVTAQNWVGFVLVANFFVWLSSYLFSDKIRAYHSELNPTKHFRGSFRQLRFLHVYLGSLGYRVSANYKAMFVTGHEEEEVPYFHGESKTA